MDEKRTKRGLSRTVGASTTHFAAIPWLLKDSDLVTTIPALAARAIVGMVPTLSGEPCPPALRDRPIQQTGEALTDSTTVFDGA
ncbi:hypothetical protein [Lonsdalea iberica]|uniref:Uncharacterized protein n=1 Tax=Lonsdalea iberica TaxID=1082703 RepID=A0A1X3RZM6_9GAMM|nr:hypothetical protein [Lonsdalea iberica]OSN07609.1 hypothetical protein AU511_03315 [Lonsdalea iberica]